jgi:hypothetical protein
MDGECSTHWGEAYRALVGKPVEKNHLKDLGVDGIFQSVLFKTQS